MNFDLEIEIWWW